MLDAPKQWRLDSTLPLHIVSRKDSNAVARRVWLIETLAAMAIPNLIRSKMSAQ
jgi:hypothetical protein